MVAYRAFRLIVPLNLLEKSLFDCVFLKHEEGGLGGGQRLVGGEGRPADGVHIAVPILVVRHPGKFSLDCILGHFQVMIVVGNPEIHKLRPLFCYGTTAVTIIARGISADRLLRIKAAPMKPSQARMKSMPPRRWACAGPFQ